MKNSLINSSVAGFFTAWIGMFGGMTLSFIIAKRGNRVKGTLLGFVGGLMLATVCFDLLPESFETGNLYLGLAGAVLGLAIGAYLDGNVKHSDQDAMSHGNSRFFKSAVLMALGVGIHNVPSGVALGSMLAVSQVKGLHLGAVFLLHGIPEGLAIGVLLKEYGAGLVKMLLFSLYTSIPMGISTGFGRMIGTISPVIISASLAFAAGLILYITCRETLPQAKATWKGRLETIGNVLGIVSGVLMITFTH